MNFKGVRSPSMETHHPNMVSQAGVSDRPEGGIIHENERKWLEWSSPAGWVQPSPSEGQRPNASMPNCFRVTRPLFRRVSVARSNRLMGLNQSNIVRYRSNQCVQLQTANPVVRAVEMGIKSPCSHGQRPMPVPRSKCRTRLLS